MAKFILTLTDGANRKGITLESNWELAPGETDPQKETNPENVPLSIYIGCVVAERTNAMLATMSGRRTENSPNITQPRGLDN